MEEDDTYVTYGPRPLAPLPNISLGQLAYDSLVGNPSLDAALIDAATLDSISYHEIFSRTCALATALRENGYGRNTIALISSENSIHFFIPVISLLYVGATIVTMNHNYTPREMLHCLDICKPKIIFCSNASQAKFMEIQKSNAGSFEKIIVIDSNEKRAGSETLNYFISPVLKGHLLSNKFLLTDVDPENDIAFILFSSGTTGLPKGVMLTHSNLMARYMHTIDPRYVTCYKNFLGVLPFFHGYGLITNFFALLLKQQIIVIKQFEPKIFFQAIQDYKIATLWLAPPLIILLAKSPLAENYDLSCIREITSGAAPLGKNIEATILKRFNLTSIRQGYGLTEATLAVLMIGINDFRIGSSGKMVSYMSCKIRDPETGRSLGPGKVGELCLKGPMVMKGYYNNSEATRQSFTSDGWLLTGDLAYYDNDSFFYVVDRLKELIKYKGFQVAPAELEGLLLKNSKIRDVAVVGKPDEECGEVPVAFVVKSEGENLTEKEVVDFVAKNVSSQKRLRGGVIFVEQIPKNPSGKLLRRELRKMIINQKSKL